ncbi:Uma2 family endonuclease [Leptothoe spongobia]|uniref:Uma2 family endonuclease n=1 Tax=Leptothoe spongobia TAU-MAC 1115 TaxID=1967444 RepID=A0A947DHF4_9CYAN|nr:Uma2 family endonuclease [Leptothoe spongobia]MBT9317108.1 Uma2 family endonuclease [Leptothoe spongobia TAU-MAC 1115]
MLTLPITLDLKTVNLTDEQFYQLCVTNPEIQVERTPQGDLILMSPVGGDSGNQEIELGADLVIWNRRTKLGKVFSSSTIFRLPNGGDRSPDAAWVELSRWEALTPEQRRKFPPISPDFVIEVRSPSDSLKTLQNKMQEYLDSGVRLGWLFNPKAQQVEIYRLGNVKETHGLPATLSGEDVLPGFTLRVNSFGE